MVLQDETSQMALQDETSQVSSKSFDGKFEHQHSGNGVLANELLLRIFLV